MDLKYLYLVQISHDYVITLHMNYALDLQFVKLMVIDE
jgi:hypothetical protein